MEYPANHKQIVKELLDGKFILNTNVSLFKTLDENIDDYKSFFDSSFGYELVKKSEFFYLVSDESNETLSRNIIIFLAVLCYELDQDQKNFREQIRYPLSVYDIENYLMRTNTAYSEILREIKIMPDVEKFLKQLAKRNIVEFVSEKQIKFTPVVELFFDYAKELAEKKSEDLALQLSDNDNK
ncbi:MAG TPA: hypothetical protein DCE80_10970 [Ignavibacteriales bacterium]|nr:hypothetical protein [Ignavibacteriales bacterium]